MQVVLLAANIRISGIVDSQVIRAEGLAMNKSNSPFISSIGSVPLLTQLNSWAMSILRQFDAAPSPVARHAVPPPAFRVVLVTGRVEPALLRLSEARAMGEPESTGESPLTVVVDNVGLMAAAQATAALGTAMLRMPEWDHSGAGREREPARQQDAVVVSGAGEFSKRYFKKA